MDNSQVAALLSEPLQNYKYDDPVIDNLKTEAAKHTELQVVDEIKSEIVGDIEAGAYPY